MCFECVNSLWLTKVNKETQQVRSSCDMSCGDVLCVQTGFTVGGHHTQSKAVAVEQC